MDDGAAFLRAAGFDAAWAAGKAPDIASYLEGIVGAERETLLRWLVRKDIKNRLAAGTPFEFENYARRFPEFAAAIEDVWRTLVVVGAANADAGTARSEAVPAPKFPIVIPGLELLTLVGEGGQGTVYKARDDESGQIVAVKVGSGGGQARDRFRAEAEIAARLRHSGIVRVMGVGDAGGLPYLRMEYIDGFTLREERETAGMRPIRAAYIVVQVAEAVHHAHERGIIHRDLKPGNILIDTTGLVKVTDFGSAKDTELDRDLTETAAVIGTPGYMAPEQAEGTQAIDARTDVYGIGAVLYFLLTGAAPFSGGGSASIRSQIVQDRPAPPSELAPGIPATLEAICLKCLEKNPGARYGNAYEIAVDLSAFTRKESPPYLLSISSNAESTKAAIGSEDSSNPPGEDVPRSSARTSLSSLLDFFRKSDRTLRGRIGGSIILGLWSAGILLTVAVIVRWSAGPDVEARYTLFDWMIGSMGAGWLAGVVVGAILGLPPGLAGHWVKQAPIEWLTWTTVLLLNLVLLLSWPVLLVRWLLLRLGPLFDWQPRINGWSWILITSAIFAFTHYWREAWAVRWPRAVGFSDRVRRWWSGNGFHPGRPWLNAFIMTATPLAAALIFALVQCAVYSLLFNLNEMETGLHFLAGTGILFVVLAVPLWVNSQAGEVISRRTRRVSKQSKGD